MTIEAFLVTLIVAFIIQLLNEKIKNLGLIIKDKPIECLILLGIITLIIMQFK